MRISGNIVDILSKEIYAGSIVIKDGVISEIIRDGGEYDRYILPPFIDAHVHVESSMLVPTEFARLASVHGTGASVSDPHEIANVLGMDGVKFMLENAENTPFRFYFGAPSCVPATPFETAGGEVTLEDIRELFKDDRIKYLSEMMNVPGVLYDDADVKAKLEAALDADRVIDGHAPTLMGEGLGKYVRSGITSDHEAISYDEGLAKIELGMKVQIREGSAAKNFEELYELMKDHPQMCMLCSDDLHPDNLAKGHINLLVKRALDNGVPLMNVLYSACVTPVEHYGLECGLLRKGDSVDMIVVGSLDEMNVTETYIKGELCAKNGRPMLKSVKTEHVNLFEAKEKSPADFASDVAETDIIVVEDGQLVTGRMKGSPNDEGVLKMTVVNRYADAAPAVGFVKNFGLKAGAIASSVAHDSHNIICVGCDDESIAKAVNIVIKNRGGLSAVTPEKVIELPLPVGGLMTDADGYETADLYQQIDKTAKEMGSGLTSPFMTLSFMALLVIPELKLSDKGLFDGVAFKFI
jgi:adenine deaminase